jgi:hypothetical protein
MWRCACQALGAAALLLLGAATSTAFTPAHVTIALHALNVVCLRLAQCPHGPAPPANYAVPADAANTLGVPEGSAAGNGTGPQTDSRGFQGGDASVTPCVPPAPYASSMQPPPPMVRFFYTCLSCLQVNGRLGFVSASLYRLAVRDINKQHSIFGPSKFVPAGLTFRWKPLWSKPLAA